MYKFKLTLYITEFGCASLHRKRRFGENVPFTGSPIRGLWSIRDWPCKFRPTRGQRPKNCAHFGKYAFDNFDF